MILGSLMVILVLILIWPWGVSPRLCHRHLLPHRQELCFEMWNMSFLDYNEMGCPIVSCQTHVDSKNLFKWKYSLRPIHSQRASRIAQVRRLTNYQDYRFRSGSTNHLFTSSPDRIRLAVAVNKVGPMWCSSLAVKHIVSWVGAIGAMFTPFDSKGDIVINS